MCDSGTKKGQNYFDKDPLQVRKKLTRDWALSSVGGRPSSVCFRDPSAFHLCPSCPVPSESPASSQRNGENRKAGSPTHFLKVPTRNDGFCSYSVGKHKPGDHSWPQCGSQKYRPQLCSSCSHNPTLGQNDLMVDNWLPRP